MLFVAVNVGASAPNPDQRTFCKKSFGISKTFAKIKWCVCAKVLRIFKGLFQKPLEARLGTQFQLLMKNKKRGFSAFFGVYYQLWLSAPNPDTRDFSRKVPWNLKSLARINLYVRCEVLWLTFLRKKGVFTVCV